MRRALVDMRPDRFEDLIALVALYRPGPMANIPTYCARKLGHEQTEYLHPKLEPILQATYGVITYQEQVQQIASDLAGYRLGEADLLRRAMGKKDRKEMASQRERFISGAVERGIGRGRRRGDLRRLRQVRRIRLQQIALGALCAAHLPDRLHEGELSGRVPGRLDDARHGQHRQARRIPRRGGAARHQGRAALGQPLRRRVRCRRATPSTTRSRRSRASAAQAVEAIVAARGEQAVRRPRRFRPPHQSARRQQARAGKPRRRRRLRRARAEPRARLRRRRRDAGGGAARPRGRRDRPDRNCSAARARASRWRCRRVEPWLPAERLQKEFDAIGFFLSGHPLDDYAAALKRLRVQSWAEFARAVKAGASAGRVAGTVVSRTERRTRTGSKMGIIGLSDPTGHYEAVLFSEGLAQYPRSARAGHGGAAVALRRSAGRRRARPHPDRSSRSMRRPPSCRRAARVPAQRGADRERRQAAASRPAPRRNGGRSSADGEGRMVLMLRKGTEVEVKLPGRFKVSPQIAGAIKAVPGVVEVRRCSRPCLRVSPPCWREISRCGRAQRRSHAKGKRPPPRCYHRRRHRRAHRRRCAAPARLRGRGLRALAKLEEVGAGLQVGPNGVKVFRALGLEDELRATPSSRPTSVSIKWDDASLRHREPLKAIARREIRRALHDRAPRRICTACCATRCRRRAITLGANCIGADTSNGGAVARFADGSEVEADVVIGADGIRSAIRAQHFGADKPRFTEMMCWRCMVPMECVPTRFGPDGRSSGRARRVSRLDRAERPRDLLSDRRRRRCSTSSAGHVTDQWVEESWSVPSSTRRTDRRQDGLERGAARHVPQRRARLQMGHLRSRSGAAMDARPRDAARRRRASDHADAGAGRQHGDRGRLCAGAALLAPRRRCRGGAASLCRRAPAAHRARDAAIAPAVRQQSQGAAAAVSRPHLDFRFRRYVRSAALCNRSDAGCYSGFMPANFTTLPHLSISSARKLPKFDGRHRHRLGAEIGESRLHARDRRGRR